MVLIVTLLDSMDVGNSLDSDYGSMDVGNSTDNDNGLHKGINSEFLCIRKYHNIFRRVYNKRRE